MEQLNFITLKNFIFSILTAIFTEIIFQKDNSNFIIKFNKSLGLCKNLRYD